MHEEKIIQFTQSINPATDQEIGSTRVNTIDELKEIINNARKVQKEWEKITVKERAKQIIKIRDYLVDNIDDIAKTITNDNGKAIVDSLATEVLAVAMAITYYCKNAPKFLKDEKLKRGNIFLSNKRSKIIRVPYGVIGIISPWNYPFTIPFSEVIMGLISGNAVVLKGASETLKVSSEIQNAVNYAKLPEGLFSVVNIPGSIAGDALLENRIDKLFFTGSVNIGKYLMSKASQSLTPISLELGGNDAMIVCDDADPYRAAMGALWAGFQNAGQTCSGIERIYVHENIYDKITEILKEKIENLNVGIGTDYNTEMGCMTTKKQIEIVNLHINDAVKKGAVVLAQSKLPKYIDSHNFIPAVVLTNVNHDMLLMKEETFGPVAGIMKFKTEEEAIAFANDSQYGLSASVWSKNKKRAEKIARKIKAGAVMVNDHLMSHGLAETPWGGFKESGIGRTHGKYGLHDKTQPIVVVHDLFSFTKKNLWWYPYSKEVYEGLRGLLLFLYHKKIIIKLKSALKLIKIIPRVFKQE